MVKLVLIVLDQNVCVMHTIIWCIWRSLLHFAFVAACHGELGLHYWYFCPKSDNIVFVFDHQYHGSCFHGHWNPTNFSHRPGQESNFLSRTICLTPLPLHQFSCKSIARATRTFSPIDLASSPSPPCKMNSCMVFWSHLKSMAEIVVLFLFVNRKDEKRQVLM